MTESPEVGDRSDNVKRPKRNIVTDVEHDLNVYKLNKGSYLKIQGLPIPSRKRQVKGGYRMGHGLCITYESRINNLFTHVLS